MCVGRKSADFAIGFAAEFGSASMETQAAGVARAPLCCDPRWEAPERVMTWQTLKVVLYAAGNSSFLSFLLKIVSGLVAQ